jgi:hypothetical protein
MRLRIVTISVLWLCSPCPAQAGSATYFVSIYADAGIAEAISRGNVYTPGPQSEPYTEVVDPVYFESAPNIVIQGWDIAGGSALANRGVLKVASQVSQTAQGGTLAFYGTTATTESRAEYSFDDVIVRHVGPGAPPPFAFVHFRFSLDGLMPDPIVTGNLYDTFLTTNFPNEVFAGVSTGVLLSVSLRSASYAGNGGGDVEIETETTYAAGSAIFGPRTSGVFVGRETAVQNGNPFIAEVPFFGVPVGEPLTLTVSLKTRGQSSYGFPENGGAWQSVANVYFDRTLSFATDYVATLPAGVTLDSAAGGITDNVWTPAPEPSAEWLRLAVVAVLARIARAHGCRPR